MTNPSDRASIYREFNFSERVIKVFDLEEELRELKRRTAETDRLLLDAKNQLPAEVIEVYERQRTFDTLRGVKSVND